MTSRRLLAQLLLSLLCVSACVTQTERRAYYPYARYKEDDSLGTALQREFGWQTDSRRASGEPFYLRAVREVKETVSGWFHEKDEAPPLTDEQKLRASRQQFEQERQEAFRRLQAQQELNQLLGRQ
jgi:hypothetical protein